MITSKILEKILKEVQKKHKVNLEQIDGSPEKEYYKNYVYSKIYFQWIIDEVEEALEQNRENNSVYLEDELSDILWDFLNLIYFLEKEEKINLESVFKRCLQKYSQRTAGLKKGVSWDNIKTIQKQQLIQEHKEKYEQ